MTHTLRDDWIHSGPIKLYSNQTTLKTRAQDQSYQGITVSEGMLDEKVRAQRSGHKGSPKL